jgi:hypothetical protein
MSMISQLAYYTGISLPVRNEATDLRLGLTIGLNYVYDVFTCESLSFIEYAIVALVSDVKGVNRGLRSLLDSGDRVNTFWQLDGATTLTE